MNKKPDEANETQGQFVDGTGPRTGTDSEESKNELFKDVKGIPDAGVPADQARETLRDSPPLEPREEKGSEDNQNSEPCSSTSERLQFEMQSKATVDSDGVEHRTGEIRLKKDSKEPSKETARKRRYRAKKMENGWKRLDITVRLEVSKPLQALAAAMNESCLSNRKLSTGLAEIIASWDDAGID